MAENPNISEIKKKDAAFDLTPMIDATFLLIIFFMCVTEMAKQELEALTLPKATKAIKDEKAPKSRQVVNITYLPPSQSTGSVRSDIIIRGKKYNEQERLIEFLKLKVTQFEKEKDEKGVSLVSVKIRADGRAEYQKVQQVMVACMKAGISRIAIGTEPKSGG
ncbi:MAG: biopolymer transporter ExbD [Planctomycetota bacterium]|nr:biopolymer transporter ExbD [Planctomycetota bacterium]